MATANNTIKTRIQLKSDTEANWNKAGPKEGSSGFVPLLGELIVYTEDATHPFPRFKVGDGQTNVVSLPFADPGFIKIATRNEFPLVGSENRLYIDLSTNKLYHYTANNGYQLLMDFSVTKSNIGSVTSFNAGSLPTMTVQNNVLVITNGRLPQLDWMPRSVVTNITKG